MARKRIVLLGATGSIGRSALEVVKSRPDLFEIAAASANTNEDSLIDMTGSLSRNAKLCLTGAIPHNERIEYSGMDGLARMLADTQAEMVLNGIAGSGGLEPSFAAIESGKDLALANKETVVLAGRLIQERAAQRGVHIVPVDSEHSAIFQLLERFGRDDLEEIILTASGGAFRDRDLKDLPNVGPEEASTHPNWSMGRKITIDSASMANKGLEVIEAVRLFGVSPDRVKVLIHPQSLIHALIRTRDGALYAQATGTDMKLAIQSALSWPRNEGCAFGRLDLAGRSLSFQEPDPLRYPLLGIAYSAVESGEGYTIAYNAADESAVSLFIEGRIRFTDIALVVGKVVERSWPARVSDLEQVRSIDSSARIFAAEAAEGL